MPSSMTRTHAFWVPLVFAVFSLINVAHAQDCAPSGSVDILVELGADTVDLQLHVDTAATAGFDAGLDSLCQVDSTAAYACLSLDTTLYVTASLPPNGETALSFDLLVQSDTIAPVVTFDLGEWLLLAFIFFPRILQVFCGIRFLYIVFLESSDFKLFSL